ncbi:3-mercaptopyruvate sulfurtransferase [Paracoccus aurantiacus]|uniref:3-mercaptopyruvate sulfurtransferase n=1 Tax=Paracoccus aurantiacus TaxID=2599412 RepID=A0A5C6SAA9_9RHOB|nr:3-mercaptopyruvate sulfurtransferase [Paracoccus aurantiacus]
MTDDPKTLVSTAWLAAHLDDPDLRILDASWHMPAAGRDAKAEFEAWHIPGARFFDIDAVSDQASDLPHMAPSAQEFARHMAALGISADQQVVIYDQSATRSAARAWWTFRLMGHDKVAVLDGGLAKWLEEARDVSTDPTEVEAADYRPSRRAELVRDAAQVAAASATGDEHIVDARAADRFRGDAPEPRAGLASGHIPGSRNLPFGQIYNSDGTMKDTKTLRALFEGAGIDLSRPVITSCGSGVTAASLSLALERLGHKTHSLYDGSWTEWGALPNANIATGDA